MTQKMQKSSKTQPSLNEVLTRATQDEDKDKDKETDDQDYDKEIKKKRSKRQG
jgi:hypothetical protein